MSKFILVQRPLSHLPDAQGSSATSDDTANAQRTSTLRLRGAALGSSATSQTTLQTRNVSREWYVLEAAGAQDGGIKRTQRSLD